MSKLSDARRLLHQGRVVEVTNHYITRTDHPCYGTVEREIARTTSSHLWFVMSGMSGNVPWPKAAQLDVDERNGVIRFWGGGAGQPPDALFLTIRL